MKGARGEAFWLVGVPGTRVAGGCGYAQRVRLVFELDVSKQLVPRETERPPEARRSGWWGWGMS